MRDLICHPDTLCAPVESITIEIARAPAGRMTLTYIVSGDIEQLALTGEGPPMRQDGLWQHICFEAFVKQHGTARYFEYNFAPSCQWAAYQFEDYRAAMAMVPMHQPPVITGRWFDRRYILAVSFDLPPALLSQDLLIGLSAVIETIDGAKSYWALAHPSDRPDFHHPESFIQPVRALDL